MKVPGRVFVEDDRIGTMAHGTYDVKKKVALFSHGCLEMVISTEEALGGPGFPYWRYILPLCHLLSLSPQNRQVSRLDGTDGLVCRSILLHAE